MGFELSALVSSALDPRRRQGLIRAARRRWPQLRLAVAERDQHPERAVLGGVERSGASLRTEAAGLLAEMLDEGVLAGLPAFSAEFPEIALAWVHTDCFGGHCESDGQVFRGGEVVLSGRDLGALLAAVGLGGDGYFAAFERGYFGSGTDPRLFAATVSLRELAESLEGFEADERAALVGQAPGDEPPRWPPAAPGPLRAGELAATAGEPRRLRTLVCATSGVAGGDLPLVGPAPDHPLVFARGGAVDRSWTLCVAEAPPAPGAGAEAREAFVEAALGELGPRSEEDGPEGLCVVIPQLRPGSAAALARSFERALARRWAGARAPTLAVVDAELYAAKHSAALGPAAASFDPPACWIDRTLEARRAGGPLSGVEAALVASLDRDPFDTEAFAVLVDWLAERGEGAQAELLAAALARARAKEGEGEFEGEGELEDDALARRAATLRAEIWGEAWGGLGFELDRLGREAARGLALTGEGAEGRARLERWSPWWPQLWLSWRGPWLTRLTLRSAWLTRFDAKPAQGDLWARHVEIDAAYRAVAALLASPCARYLSARRVSLLGSPMTPDLGGRRFDGWTMRGLALAGASLPGASFRGARLRSAAFEGADLRGVDLRGALLEGVDLRGADLRGADLRAAEFARAQQVDLRCADLRGACLEGARLGEPAALVVEGARVGSRQREALARLGVPAATLARVEVEDD
ncbi:pentapeptide repeat-containing protein [Pseudenhygromyxa sp. WMMC2535]|uniref:pentapeptide repeat-containing protein n=1 Tax=Pseudenhygromyxa sp. WMMC2535 TaxID=2712867 RepID=UPI0031F8E06C